MAKLIEKKWILQLIAIVIIGNACTFIRPYKFHRCADVHFKPAYLKGEFYYNDSLCSFSLYAVNKLTPRNQMFILNTSGLSSFNDDSTMITINSIENQSVTKVKKSINGWVIKSAYNIHVKEIEFTPLHDSLLNFNLFQKSIAVDDSLMHLPEVELQPMPFNSNDFDIGCIILLKNNNYIQVVYSVVFSSGKYYVENGLLVLNEKKTGNVYRLKILDADTTFSESHLRGAFVSDEINDCYDYYPVYYDD